MKKIDGSRAGARAGAAEKWHGSATLVGSAEDIVNHTIGTYRKLDNTNRFYLN